MNQNYKTIILTFLSLLGTYIAQAQCSFPSIQAQNFHIESSTTNNSTITWVRGDGDQVIVVGRLGNPVNQNPVDGTVYAANASFGNGTNLGNGNFVVYIGSGTSVNLTNMLTNSAYHFAVFEFNNPTTPCYNILEPTQGIVYCRPATGNGGKITNVTIAEVQSGQVLLNNSNSLTAADNYQYINNQTIPTLAVGAEYSFSITREGSGQRRLNVIIDYNSDGFLDLQGASLEGETIYNLAPPNLNTITFNYTIPPSASDGRKLIRFRSFAQNTALGICLNSAVAGETEDYWINISSEPLPPTCNTNISPSVANICEGGSIALQASGAANYTWSDAQGLSCTDCPNPIASPNVTTEYQVIGTNGECSDTAYITVTVYQPDELEIITTPVTGDLCNGSVTLSIPGSFSNVNWSNGQAGGSQLEITEPGQYSVTATGPSTCLSTSQQVTIIQSPTPIVEINPSGSVLFCGEPIILTATPAFGFYEWSNGANSSSIQVSESGFYFVNVMNNNGCFGQSETVNVTEGEHPVADFEFNQDIQGFGVQFNHLSNSGANFIWNFGDGNSSNESNPFHEYDFDGIYNVELIVINDCGNDTIIKEIVVIKTALKDIASNVFYHVYPNPFQDQLNIVFDGNFAIKNTIQIIDLTGKELYEEQFDASSNALKTIQMPDLSAGVYFLSIKNELGIFTSKVIKH
jgi:hypothetical protein